MVSVPFELQVVKISRAFHYGVPHNHVVVLVCKTPAGTKYTLQKKLPHSRVCLRDFYNVIVSHSAFFFFNIYLPCTDATNRIGWLGCVFFSPQHLV